MQSARYLHDISINHDVPAEKLNGLLDALREDWGLPPLSVPDTLAAPAEYIVPVPDGYDTVVGYLAKRGSSAMFGTPSEIIERTQRDGFWLKHRTGNDYYTVPAPKPLRSLGIARINAYPVELLANRSDIQRERDWRAGRGY
jgi:hypothetical protein